MQKAVSITHDVSARQQRMQKESLHSQSVSIEWCEPGSFIIIKTLGYTELENLNTLQLLSNLLYAKMTAKSLTV